MNRMAGCVGVILAVPLLGCSHLCWMARKSQTVSISWGVPVSIIAA